MTVIPYLQFKRLTKLYPEIQFYYSSCYIVNISAEYSDDYSFFLFLFLTFALFFSLCLCVYLFILNLVLYL